MYQKHKKFFKHIATSIASSIVDLVLFEVFFLLIDQHGEGKAILIATVISRIISSIVDYILNRKIVFHSIGKKTKEIYKFIIIIVSKMFLSAVLVAWVNSLVDFSEMIIKCIIDATLFVIFYSLEKNWVYKQRIENK